MLRKPIIVFLVLTAFGVVRWPMESAVTKEFKARHILAPELPLSLREKLGQNSYAAALGGARSFIASIQSLMALSAWEVQDWGMVENRYRMVTELQPRVPSYWEMAAWHMAYNASGWYRYDWKPHRDKSRKQADPAAIRRYRIEMWERYIRKGQELLDAGIRNNPENYRLLEQAGMLAADPLKLPDNNRAANYYGLAAALPGSPERIRRFEAYELSYVPARRAEALEKLTNLYQAGRQHHVPTLLCTLFDLQLAYSVPENVRISLLKPGESQIDLYHRLRDYTAYRRSRNSDISQPLLAYLQTLEETLKIPFAERLKVLQ